MFTISLRVPAVFILPEERLRLHSFREPATDGLHLAYSNDGYHWTDLGGGYLKSEVGGKLVRDPSIASCR